MQENVFFSNDDKTETNDIGKGFLAITAPPGDPAECALEQRVVLLENNICSRYCLTSLL